MKKQCLDCGEAFMGRSDKKFCTDMCRNAYHNKYNGYRNAMIRYVNHKLRKNRFILFKLGQNEPGIISRDELSLTGFDWQFFTEEMKAQTTIRRYCYDYGIEFMKEDQIRVVYKSYPSRVLKDESLSLAAEPDALRDEILNN